MAVKQYTVCAPRKYKNGQGQEQTHFWPIGKAFPLKNKDGFSLKLYTRLLPSDELVIFADDLQQVPADEEPPPKDNVPF